MELKESVKAAKGDLQSALTHYKREQAAEQRATEKANTSGKGKVKGENCKPKAEAKVVARKVCTNSSDFELPAENVITEISGMDAVARQEVSEAVKKGVPFKLTDICLKTFAKNAPGETLADELSDFLEDSKTSELRVTHGRAQSPIGSADLATYIHTALHKLVKDHAPSGEQMFAEVPREAHPLLHDALSPAMHAILERFSDTRFEICNQAALRLNLQGQRQMPIFPSEALKTFLTHAMRTDGNPKSNKTKPKVTKHLGRARG